MVMLWDGHFRLGHPVPQALRVNCFNNARIRGLTTVEGDACGQGEVNVGYVGHLGTLMKIFDTDWQLMSMIKDMGISTP
jgi:hypothetical protein